MNPSSGRRSFLKYSVMGAAVAGTQPVLGAPSQTAPLRRQRPAEWRNRQAGMRYRPLGATGLMVSAIGIGSSFSEDNYTFIHEAVERGSNYIDTAHRYRGGRSEQLVGKILREVGRDTLFVATKLSRWKWAIDEYCMDLFKGLPGEKQESLRRRSRDIMDALGVTRPGIFYKLFKGHENELPTGYLTYVIRQEYPDYVGWKTAFKAEMFKSIDESLSRMGIDHVDILHAPHGARMPQELEDPLVAEIFDEIRKQGKARFFGASFHSDMVNTLSKAAALPYYDMVMPAYNIVSQGSMDYAIARAADKGLGIYGMKAANPILKGDIPAWRIQKLHHAVRGELTLAQKAYAWVLGNPHVSGCLSAMQNQTMLKENLGVLEKEYSIHPL